MQHAKTSGMAGLLLLIGLSPVASQSEAVVALRGAVIHTAAGAPIPNGVIVVTNGKITAVGVNVAIPSGAKIYDVGGKEVIPGMLDNHSHIGALTVNEASVNLLGKELEDQQRRYDAGTVPRFNVLRAEVSVANARPALIRARNDHRIAKNNLSNLLGYNLPRDIWEDVPLQLTDTLVAEPYQVDLPFAIQQALEKRTELGALRKARQLQDENVINARAGYQPTLEAFAGYGFRSAQFKPPVVLDHQISGWQAGLQLNWDIFDGFLTKGKVMQAKAQRERAATELDDTSRHVELEVRTAYSIFVEAKEVLDSQLKVQEQADEALRLARARADAGTGTQLEVLDAETALTQARTTQIVALHDYSVARAKLERAIGNDLVQKTGN